MDDLSPQNHIWKKKTSPEVLCEHEVCAEKFEAVLEGVHLHLRGEHGGHQGVTHARVDHLLPLPLLLHPSAGRRIGALEFIHDIINLQEYVNIHQDKEKPDNKEECCRK